MTANGEATSSVAEGVVVWFRPEMGVGVLKLRNGRQYRFTELDGLDMVLSGQVVRARIVEGQPAEVTVTPLPGGQTLFEEKPLPPPPKKRASAAKGTARPAAAQKKANVSAAPKPTPTKRKISGAAVKLRPRRDGSLPEGLPVLHPQHGQGFIVMSSPKVARVRFMAHEEERSVRVVDLKVLDDV
jgi:cold shock CspA family protein